MVAFIHSLQNRPVPVRITGEYCPVIGHGEPGAEITSITRQNLYGFKFNRKTKFRFFFEKYCDDNEIYLIFYKRFIMLKTLIHFLLKYGFGAEYRTTEGFEFVAVSQFGIAISYNEHFNSWVVFNDDSERMVLFQNRGIERVVAFLGRVRDGEIINH